MLHYIHIEDDVIKKWKSLRDTLIWYRNKKSKSRDGLSDQKPKWKFYDIMSFIEITLIKQGYFEQQLHTQMPQIPEHTYIMFHIFTYKLSKFVQNCKKWVNFDFFLFVQYCI